MMGLLTSVASAKDPIEGRWYTIDEEGRAGSVVRLWVEGGKLHGKVDQELGKQAGPPARCNGCDGHAKDKPILGLTVIWNLNKDGSEWEGGRILDPTTGTVYRCEAKLVGNDKLDLRGYVGISLLGRTMTWRRAPEPPMAMAGR